MKACFHLNKIVPFEIFSRRMEEIPTHQCPGTVIISFGFACLLFFCAQLNAFQTLNSRKPKCQLICTFNCSAAVKIKRLGTKAITTFENDCQ